MVSDAATSWRLSMAGKRTPASAARHRAFPSWISIAFEPPGVSVVSRCKILGLETPAAEHIAAELGHAVRLTELLRDLSRDATHDRTYLPRELLKKHGLPSNSPGSVLTHPALGNVCCELAMLAEEHYAAASVDRFLKALGMTRKKRHSTPPNRLVPTSPKPGSRGGSTSRS